MVVLSLRPGSPEAFFFNVVFSTFECASVLDARTVRHLVTRYIEPRACARGDAALENQELLWVFHTTYGITMGGDLYTAVSAMCLICGHLYLSPLGRFISILTAETVFQYLSPLGWSTSILTAETVLQYLSPPERFVSILSIAPLVVDSYCANEA